MARTVQQRLEDTANDKRSELAYKMKKWELFKV